MYWRNEYLDWVAGYFPPYSFKISNAHRFFNQTIHVWVVLFWCKRTHSDWLKNSLKFRMPNWQFVKSDCVKVLENLLYCNKARMVVPVFAINVVKVIATSRLILVTYGLCMTTWTNARFWLPYSYSSSNNVTLGLLYISAKFPGHCWQSEAFPKKASKSDSTLQIIGCFFSMKYFLSSSWQVTCLHSKI